MTPYDIGYCDGRDHMIHLIVKFVSTSRKSPERLLAIISDDEKLMDALQKIDPGYFNNYDANIGPIY